MRFDLGLGWAIIALWATLSGMSEQMKAFARQENEFTITREGDFFVDKATVGGVTFEMKLKLNEELEWKEKEENPVFHLKVG